MNCYNIYLVLYPLPKDDFNAFLLFLVFVVWYFDHVFFAFYLRKLGRENTHIFTICNYILYIIMYFMLYILT